LKIEGRQVFLLLPAERGGAGKTEYAQFSSRVKKPMPGETKFLWKSHHALPSI